MRSTMVIGQLTVRYEIGLSTIVITTYSTCFLSGLRSKFLYSQIKLVNCGLSVQAYAELAFPAAQRADLPDT